MDSGNCLNNIDALITQNRPFAVYRIPGENTFHFTGQKQCSVRLLPTIEALNGQSGFVIAPFYVSAKNPIVLIDTEEDILLEAPAILSNVKTNNICPQPSSDYTKRFDTFIRSLSDKTFDKLVLSRRITVERKAGFSPASIFYKACKRYIRSYVYLFHTPETGTWLGSTPETLLSGKANQWHTVALAGTQALQNGKLPETWSDNKRKEQQWVADYIRERLQAFHIHAGEEGPYTVQAGELAHLRTDFRFSLSGNENLGDLLNVLHPTPAICGLPKEKAFRFIIENEGYDRKYYSGFIGRLNPEDKSDLYVNLRCMQIEDNQLVLYAGGGLSASSDLQEEWQETEDKLLTMLRII